MADTRRPFEVGLLLMPTEDSARGTFPRWTEMLALVRRAEALGYDSVWIPDHLIIDIPRPGSRPEGAWEGWSLVAALAAATDRITIGLLVSCTAFRNPALLAKMADTVDEISNGRLILGLGAGWCELEFRAFGYPFDHRVGRFEEALTIVAGLLRNGSHGLSGDLLPGPRLRAAPARPAPSRTTDPRRLVVDGQAHAAASGPPRRYLEPRFRRRQSGFTPYSAADLTESQTRVDAACAAIGRDPATLERTAGVWVDLPMAPGARDGML